MNALRVVFRALSYLMILCSGFFVSVFMLYAEGVAWVISTELFKVFLGILGLGIGLGVVLQLTARRRRWVHWMFLAVATVPFLGGAYWVWMWWVN